MELLRKYNTATTIYFPLIEFGGTDLYTGAVFADGDVTFSEDGATFGNTTDTQPAQLATTSGIYELDIAASELVSLQTVIKVVDQTGPKVWEDQTILISTYGDASGQFTFDFNAAFNDTYQAKIWLLDETSNDKYAVSFYKNGGLITAGVTVPDIWVFAMDAPATALVGTSGSPTALTEASTTETWFLNTASVTVAGTHYMARVRFTVDGAQRTFMQPVGRDS